MIDSLGAEVKSGELGARMCDLQAPITEPSAVARDPIGLLNIQQLSLCTARRLQHPAPGSVLNKKYLTTPGAFNIVRAFSRS